jgi:hypothetical protein
MAAVRLWQTSNVETSFRLVAAIVFVVTSIGLTASQQALPPPNYDEANVGNYSLPDPLVFNNGEPVRTANEWLKRRQEVLELFAENMFGHSPQPPKILHYDVWDTDRNALAGKAIRKQITIYFSPKPNGPKAELLLYIPTALRRPAPVFLTLSFNGNQMAANDPAIKLATTWNPKTHEKELALEESRGKASADTERILARGTMTNEALDAILARQLPDAEKRKCADFVVDTSHGLDPVRTAISDILAEVVKMPQRRT